MHSVEEYNGSDRGGGGGKGAILGRIDGDGERICKGLGDELTRDTEVTEKDSMSIDYVLYAICAIEFK